MSETDDQLGPLEALQKELELLPKEEGERRLAKLMTAPATRAVLIEYMVAQGGVDSALFKALISVATAIRTGSQLDTAALDGALKALTQMSRTRDRLFAAMVEKIDLFAERPFGNQDDE